MNRDIPMLFLLLLCCGIHSTNSAVEVNSLCKELSVIDKPHNRSRCQLYKIGCPIMQWHKNFASISR